MSQASPNSPSWGSPHAHPSPLPQSTILPITLLCKPGISWRGTPFLHTFNKPNKASIPLTGNSGKCGWCLPHQTVWDPLEMPKDAHRAGALPPPSDWEFSERLRVSPETGLQLEPPAQDTGYLFPGYSIFL